MTPEHGVALMRTGLLPFAIGMYPQFKVGRHHVAISKALDKVVSGEIKRLMILAPPRHGKSLLTSELFPPYFLGNLPDNQLIHVSYGDSLVSSFGRKIRNHLKDGLYQSVFPGCKLSDDSAANTLFSTSAGGVYAAAGIDGTITGRGADLLLIDDPIKNRKDAESKTIRDSVIDFYKSTAFTRLMPGGRIVLIQTRWHPEDLAGWLLANEANKWHVLNLPAIAEEHDELGRLEGEPLWPQQFSLAALNDIRSSIGEREFGSLYQQRPVPAAGNVVKREFFVQGVASKGLQIVMGVDLAISERQTADYTAIVVMGKCALGKLYILDVAREQCGFHAGQNLIRQMAYKWNPQVIAVEKVQFQAAVTQELLRTTNLPVKGVEPKGDKLVRFQPVLVRYESYMVVHCGLPAYYEDELLTFPAGKNDDCVDATSLAFCAFDELVVNKAVVISEWDRQTMIADTDCGY